ncbi:epimerase [Bacillus coahuilensis p1.1.43]|uniref:Epimerase n=1 Tax=Bacillus coahuilensis p1.1.43 TaxID=1150625 RepID=A0A147K4L2_9BACI|nr:NAD-dependent epimerase/dehydratase family protein [Bacillus coahuilensis]KUP04392.1 epimerase [Bacillus coahuilensis p1.1.43]
MTSILVTGGAGFIGSHLVDHLLHRGEKVVVLDDLSMGSKTNLQDHENLIFIQGDLSHRLTIQEVFAQHSFKKVFHLGAIASVAASVEHPFETHQTNLEGTLYLLEEVRKVGSIERFVFASSAAVYGDEPTLPKREKSEIRPLTPYAIDKFASEQYVLAYSRLYGIPTAATRFFNVYGTRQNPSSPYSGVISIITDRFKKLMNGEETIFTLFGDGKQTRDFVYVEDVIQALTLVSENEEAIGRVFNVGTGKETSLVDMISILEKITSTTLPIDQKEERAGDIKHSYSCIDDLESIGFNPHYSMEAGLRKYWEEEINQ